jgi:hypothetical protein
VIDDLETTFQIYCEEAILVYARTKFHMISPNDSLVMVITLKAKIIFDTAAMLLLYILQGGCRN